MMRVTTIIHFILAVIVFQVILLTMKRIITTIDFTAMIIVLNTTTVVIITIGIDSIAIAIAIPSPKLLNPKP